MASRKHNLDETVVEVEFYKISGRKYGLRIGGDHFICSEDDEVCWWIGSDYLDYPESRIDIEEGEYDGLED